MRPVIILTLLAAIRAFAQSEPEVRQLKVEGRTIYYEIRGGYAVVEGDIIIGTAAEAEAAAREDSVKTLQPRSVIDRFNTSNPQRWPDNTIPYVIDSDIPNQQRILDG